VKRITQMDMFGRKECSTCWRVLPLDRFVRDPRKKRGVTSDCKDCRKARSKRWREANPEKVRELNGRPITREAQRAWWKVHGVRVRAERRKAAKTPEAREKNAERAREYRRRSHQYRVKSNLRSRVNYALNGRKRTKSVEQLLGCSIPDFVAHLESQWQPGMSWDNYGLGDDSWHIDHIIPCAAFDLTDPQQQRECFHYTNCRPLWAEENLSKGARLL